MKKLFKLSATLVVIAATMMSCGGGSNSSNNEFVGKYEDEFGNKFELRDDHTATIQFAGQDNVNETMWGNGPGEDSPFATISYNSNSSYYFMRDGHLYRYREDMNEGRHAIKLKRVD